MASEVEICNRALSYLGVRSIASLEESTKEARQCKILYSSARDSVLSDHKWNFANKQIELALTDKTYVGWSYVYAYPNDCLNANMLVGPDNSVNPSLSYLYDDDGSYYPTGKIEFDIVSNADLNGKLIVTNEPDAILSYTAKVTDANMFSPQFIDAVSRRLASEMALSLKGQPQLQAALLQQYEVVLSRAKAVSANEGVKKPTPSNTFLSSRY